MPIAGAIVEVRGPRNRVLGHALFSDQSQITIRMISRDEAPIDDAFWRARIEAAIRFRDSLQINATAFRLVHGEADLLPSLDRRSLRRLSGDADAVAGDGSPGADARDAAGGSDRRQGHPRAQRSESPPPRRSRAEGRSDARRCAGIDRRLRSRHHLRGRSVAWTKDRSVSRSTRESGSRRALRAWPDARLLQLQRRVRTGARGAVRIGRGP